MNERAADVRLELRWWTPPESSDGKNGNRIENDFRFQHIESTFYGAPHARIPAVVAEKTPVLWTPHLRELLLGTRNAESPLSLLRGHEDTILRMIYHIILLDLWRCSITLTPPSEAVGRMVDIERSISYTMAATSNDDDDEDDGDYDENEKREDEAEKGKEKKSRQDAEVLDSALSRDRERVIPIRSLLITPDAGAQYRSYNSFQELGNRVSDRPQIAFSTCGFVQFPQAADRNVNMMPFVMGDINSLPEYLQPYYNGAIARCPVKEEEMGRICYLTVMEGWVEPTITQRRAGLHTESPGRVRIASDDNEDDACGTVNGVGGSFVAAREHHWGIGLAEEEDDFEGGLYIASNVSKSARVFNALVDVSSEGVVDSHGGCEHLRPFFGERGRTLEAHELVWMTDRTPHEALPLETRVYRQFFRLVTSRVTLWYEEHSSKNPLGVGLPDFVQVIRGSKFSGEQAK